MKRFSWAGIALSSFVLSSAANAAGLDWNTLAALSNPQPLFRAASEDLAGAFSYKAITPAAPLGGGLIPVGFDVGVEVSATELVNKSKYAVMLPSALDFAYMPVPKVHAHVGIPFGFDAGLVYAGIPLYDINMVGGEFRYSFIKGNVALPAVSLRGTYSQFMATSAYTLTNYGYELTASKGFGVGVVITPYLGLGQVFSNATSTVKNPLIPTQNAFADESFNAFKWFVGASLRVALMNVGMEMDRTGNNNTYSIKASLRF